MLLRRLCLVVLVGLLASCSVLGGDDDVEPSASPSAPVQCTDRDELAPGVSYQTLDADGVERQYVVYAPPTYDGTDPLPVVYVVHGLGGDAQGNLAYTGLANVAETEEFLVVAPQAVRPESRWDYRTPASEPGSDAAFLRDLMDETASRWCVDAEQQYATGISNGSAMVFAMACSGDFPVKAYAGVAAAFYDPPSCDDAPPTSILYFHGTADQIVPFEGGPTPLEPVQPTPETLEAWAEHGGCDVEPSTDDVAADVEQQTWQECDAGVRLEAYIVDGGGHTWPGAPPIPGLGETTDSIAASAVIAEFFGLDA